MIISGAHAVCAECIPSTEPQRLAFELARAMPLYAGGLQDRGPS